MSEENDIEVEFPIDGELDLHLFHPRDVKDLVPDYLDECKTGAGISTASGIPDFRGPNGVWKTR